MMISDVTARGRRTRPRKRVGRGIGSGSGKTAGRGHKGMGQHGSNFPSHLREGGQMPLFRRLPKRGFSNAGFRTEYQVVNVAALDAAFKDGDRVTPASLAAAGLIRSAAAPVKILGDGELTRKLTVEATRFSATAARKIEAAGGQVKAAE